jgi:hypothetical protein
MALSVRIEPIEKNVSAMISRDLSPDEQRRIAAEFARRGIDDAKQINGNILGRIPPMAVTVDGVPNAPLESVNPNGGSIIVEFELIGEVLKWIANELVARSPVLSGAYKAGHTLYADGQPIAIDTVVPNADEYVFANVVPYARKIEIGKTKAGRPFVIQVPNQIYERVAKDARSKFGNIAKITFGYREAVGAYRLKRDQAVRRFGKGGARLSRPRSDRRAGSVVSSPAIIIRMRG